MKYPRALFALLLLALLGACAGGPVPTLQSTTASPSAQAGAVAAQDVVWPGEDWARAAPEAHGMDPGRLKDLNLALGDVQVHSFLVVRHGYLLWEYYAPGYDAYSLFDVYSVTKSVVGTLVGVAIDAGLIESVDQPITDYFEGYMRADDDPRKREITIHHLLSHTSGIDWREFGEWDYMPAPLISGAPDWVEAVLSRPMEADPGTHFDYNSGGSHLLSAILQYANGWENASSGAGMTTREYAQEELFTPLGIRRYQWGEDPQGITTGGWGLRMTAGDMARLGYLYLREGEWNGLQVAPADWVARSTQPQAPPNYEEAFDLYGYQWWVTSLPGELHAYYALGYGGQYVMVVPERDLVVVVTASIPENGLLPQEFIRRNVLPAIQD